MDNWEEELAKWVAMKMAAVRRDPMTLYIVNHNMDLLNRDKEKTNPEAIIQIPWWAI